MKRPWHIGLTVLVCLAVVFGVMGWITIRLLSVEEHNREMQRQAAEESITRLALWRMDAAVSPLIIEESARPYYEYSAFNPAQTVYPMAYNWEEVGATLVPSPLLTQSSSNVLAYFNGKVTPDDKSQRLESPQVPDAELNDWVLDNYAATSTIANNTLNFDNFTANVTVAQLCETFGGANGAPVDTGQTSRVTGSPPPRMVTANQSDAQQGLAINLPPQEEQPAPMQQQAEVQQADVQQVAMSANEQSFRYQRQLRNQERIQSGKQQVYDQNLQFYNTKVAPQRKPSKPRAQVKSTTPWSVPAKNVEEGVMRAEWIGDMLVLGRSVTVDSGRYIQGAWLDWDVIKEELLAEVRDILPFAQLMPVADSDETDRTRVMATLPVKLVPGRCATLPTLPTPSFNVPLLTAWACVLIAAGAVCFLVAGTVSLSERRAAFVSAVTHELRTPLTTFQMYSEMLSEGMVPEEKKMSYFDVLRAEGTRLSHLVENVLSYSRLEKGKTHRTLEAVALGDVIARTRDRLERRSGQAEMMLAVETPDADVTVRADTGMIEQVLFNLVDNACKYAGQAEDRRIHVTLSAKRGKAVLSVRDHGPGISRREAKRLFHPFRKSAKHAAETAPGVGLGLALSRKLARRMGGALRIDTHVTNGACFELVLPIA